MHQLEFFLSYKNQSITFILSSFISIRITTAKQQKDKEDKKSKNIDGNTGKEIEVSNCDYLTPMQEKMMATQPDMLINYAHFLKQEFKQKGIVKDPEVVVESYVTLNGKASRVIVDKSIDLSLEEDDLKPKKWIIPNDN